MAPRASEIPPARIPASSLPTQARRRLSWPPGRFTSAASASPACARAARIAGQRSSPAAGAPRSSQAYTSVADQGDAGSAKAPCVASRYPARAVTVASCKATSEARPASVMAARGHSRLRVSHRTARVVHASRMTKNRAAPAVMGARGPLWSPGTQGILMRLIVTQSQRVGNASGAAHACRPRREIEPRRARWLPSRRCAARAHSGRPIPVKKSSMAALVASGWVRFDA